MPGAVHCNLSLRPVFVKSQGESLREKRVCGAAYCDYMGTVYMQVCIFFLQQTGMFFSFDRIIFVFSQAAIGFWLNTISSSLPTSDGRFE